MVEARNDAYSTAFIQKRIFGKVSFSSNQCTLECSPRIDLLFSRRALLFPPFCFLEVPFYFLKMPYCFPKLPFSMPKVTSILYNLKTSTWSMIFGVFYSKFSLHCSLENAVSEHSKWLKFQKLLVGPAFESLQWEKRLQHPPQTSQLYCTLPTKV